MDAVDFLPELDVYGLPTFSAAVVGLQPLSAAEYGIRFDELAAVATQQPDDELAISAVRKIVYEARDNGYISAALQMAMVVGAMACLHPHLEALAREVGGSALDIHAGEHDDDEIQARVHDPATCSNCKKGRPCIKK